MSPAATNAWSSERAEVLARELADERGALLPVLHALHEEFGYVDPRAVPIVADVLNLSRAEVHGVLSFYRDFRTEPSGRRIVKICQAEACQAVGAVPLATHAQEHLGIRFGETTADGAVSLVDVFCLGNCALGPSVLVDDRVHGRVDDRMLEALLTRERD